MNSALSMASCLGFGTVCSDRGGQLFVWPCSSVDTAFGALAERVQGSLPPKLNQAISVSSCSSIFLVISCFGHLLHTISSAASVFSLRLLNGGAERIRKWISSLEAE